MLGVAIHDWLRAANWQFLLAVAVALFSVTSYILTRRRDLAWKRTEFLFKQAEYLDNDTVLVEVMTILENRHPHIRIEDLFDGSDSMGIPNRQEYIQKLDKFLSLLWRLCYAYLETKTLSTKEVEAFGWYLWLISEQPQLTNYCEEYGFDDINTVIGKLKKGWDD
jgi:hypothetical protein